MSPMATSLPYGLRDVAIRSFTDASCVTPDVGIDLPYARTFSFSEAEDFEELRGDDKLITTRGKGPSVEWELESGGLPLDILPLIAGGTIVESGVTPATVKTYRKKTSDERPYFKVEGQAISDSGGDMHGIFYRARVTGAVEGSFEDGSFWLTKAKGAGLGSLEAADLEDALYDFVQNETAEPIDLTAG
jgi:hypothetical protein